MVILVIAVIFIEEKMGLIMMITDINLMAIIVD